MRDLINLFESVGLANRKPGDHFANEQGTVLTFYGLEFFPPEGAYPTANDVTAAVTLAARNEGISPENIIWTNQPRGALAFGFAHFVDEQNQDYYFGRYFRSINANSKENYFPNDLPGGYRLQNKTAKKERAGYKPTDVLSNLTNQTPDSILKQVISKFGNNSDEANAMNVFISAVDFPVSIPRGNMDFTAFTNYFCEMLQPIALVLGKPTNGNAADAEQRFLGKAGFAACTITFGGGKTEGLVDSTLISPTGETIGVSTKAKAGAKASARNLLEKVREMQADTDGRKILDKYKTEVDILQTIVNGGYIDGPLNLAVMYKIITPEEINQVKALRKLGPQEVIGTGQLSTNLEKLYQVRKGANPKQNVPFFHLLTAIAFAVADYVNKNTNFGTAGSAILNYGGFVQAHTHAKLKGDQIILEPFDVRYPSEAVTNVLLSADKTYYSTGNKGNFSFKILKNGATEDEVDVQDKKVDTKPDVDLDALDKFSQQRSSVKASKDKVNQDHNDETNFGRKRR